MIRKITIPAFCDPGHSWYKVPIKLLEQMGIVENVSYCSFKRKDSAYIEGDGDAVFLFQKLEENGIQFKVKYNHSNKYSKIRSYVPFTQKELWKNPFKQEN